LGTQRRLNTYRISFCSRSHLICRYVSIEQPPADILLRVRMRRMTRAFTRVFTRRRFPPLSPLCDKYVNGLTAHHSDHNGIHVKITELCTESEVKFCRTFLFLGPCIFNNVDKNRPKKCTN